MPPVPVPDAEVLFQQALRLHGLRFRRHLKQKDVASQAGLSPARLSRIEQGRSAITLAEVAKLMRVYRCQPWDIAPELALDDVHEDT